MVSHRRAVLLLVVLLSVALTAAAGGCRSERAAQVPAAAERPAPAPRVGGGEGGGTLRYAISEPSALIPAEASTPSEFAVVGALFDSLTGWGPDLGVQPRAAASWSSNEAATQWTFQLRPDATFHDGSPVTAADVEFAWELAVTTDGAGYHLRNVRGYQALRRGDVDDLEGVTALGAHRLRVELVKPNVNFPTVVAHPALAPVPEDVWKQDPEAFREQPVGNGPFALLEPWARGDFVRVSRFDEWRNGSGPQLAEVVFQITNRATAFVAFQQGRMDVTRLPMGALDAAQRRYGESSDGYTGPGVLTGETLALYLLGFAVDRAPVDEPQVRKAVSLAIDRQALASQLREGNVTPARSLVPPAVPGHEAGMCRHCRHNPEAAEQLFDAHGVSELTLWINEEGGHAQVAASLRRDLAAVGVDLTVHTVNDFPSYLDALRKGRAALFRFGWTLDYPTMGNALRPLLHSEAQPSDDAGFNYSGYANETVDALLEEGRATFDADSRYRRYRQVENLVLNRDQVLVPVFFTRHRLVVSERVSGFVYTPMRTVNLAAVRIAGEGRTAGPPPAPPGG